MSDVVNQGKLRCVLHRVDLCVVGGGLAGMCAAIAAARRGLRVVLMHDRPVPGGNASPEIRMWIMGARGANNRETGIIEELLLENRYRNPLRNYSLWGSILYEAVKFQKGIILLLNCSCNGAEMDGPRIRSITGWQTTTQTWHTVDASVFADCSGDSILAPLSGAEYRMGREASAEFGESIAPQDADCSTMGMSLLLQARETDRAEAFIPPAWAAKFASDADLPHRDHDLSNPDPIWNNFWWIEAGGDRDTIHDTEEIRDELLRVVLGVWDHIKNQGDHGADRWALEWFGFLPGKRESRRYVGDYIVTENDVRAGGPFDDIVAYAGWPMDDHHPAGINYPGVPSTLYPAPSPWGVPYRAIYSRNIDNLLFAGRNISITHAAFSSSRVMATCALLGQAAGTAAAVAVHRGATPRGVGRDHLSELQQALMDDDCYLPGLKRRLPSLTISAELIASEGDPQPLRNGIDRSTAQSMNNWSGRPGAWVEYRFATPQRLRRLRFVFDSDLNRTDTNMLCKYPRNMPRVSVPPTIIRGYRVDLLNPDGQWDTAIHEQNNRQRLVRHDVDATAKAVRFVPESTWGSDRMTLFAWDVE